jgi:ankyrin repeat protein
VVFEKVREGDRMTLAAAVRADPKAIEWRDSLGYTLLHWAAAVDDDAAVRLLLDAGADPNARDVRGQTPLHVAAMSQIRSGGVVMNTLLGRGACVDPADTQGFSPLQIAQRVNRDDLAQTLVAAGAKEPAKATDVAATAAAADSRVADARPAAQPHPAAARSFPDARPRRPRPFGPLRAWARLNGLRPPPPPALRGDG